VDDWDMRITHVIRGDDHLNNTPRQMNILAALGATLPQYAHVPMILGDDGQRLSKRHGAVSVLNYQEQGFLPEAVLNYLVRLGWAHGDQEIFSRQEMIDLFDINQVNGKPSAFNTEKLLWLNQHYMKTNPPEQVADFLKFQLDRMGIDARDIPLAEIVKIQAERSKTLKEMAENSLYFFNDAVTFDDKAVQKNLTRDAFNPLNKLLKQLENLTEWTAEAIHAEIHHVATELDLKLGKVAQPLRVAVTGGTVSPPIDITVFLIGKTRTVARIQRAVSLIPTN
jgi:glutamyl-tRNA synthetase